DSALKVIVKKKAVEKIKRGMSPLARDVIYYDERIRPGDEVLLLDEDGNFMAVGRAVVSGSTIKGLERGVVVKIRKSLKEN
ncbi:MAG: pseudouridine synthase, partial [Thaumarchaeota archaeon]